MKKTAYETKQFAIGLILGLVTAIEAKNIQPTTSTFFVGIPELTIAIILGMIFVAYKIIKSSIIRIGAHEVGILNKKIGRLLLPGQQIAYNGEAGYQAKILPPGTSLALALAV